MPVLATTEGGVAPRSRDGPEAGKAAQSNSPKDIITCSNEHEFVVFFGDEVAWKQDIG